MAVKNIKWNVGEGYIHVSQSGGGRGNTIINISSDENTHISRTQTITFATTSSREPVKKELVIHQDGVYDGGLSSTPSSEYDFILDCGDAASVFNPEADFMIDCGDS